MPRAIFGSFRRPIHRLVFGVISVAIVLVTAGIGRGEEGADPATLDTFAIETWQTDRGLPQSSVNALIQTRDGYLWMGTYNGLARFDGVRFVVFDSANTPMRNSRVTSVCEDSQGSVWIGHEGGELTRLANGGFSSMKVTNWPGGAVQNIGEDESGDVWAMSVRGYVIRLRDGLLLEPFQGIGEEPGGGPEMVRDQAGRLIVSRNGAAALLERGRWSPLRFDDPGAYYSRVYPARTGGLWVAGNGRVRRWQNGRWVQHIGDLPPGLSFMPTLSETRSGRVLAGSIHQGLIVYQPDNRRFTVGTAEGLPHDWVKCVLEDRERNIWVGTRAGLTVLRPRKVVMRSPPDAWRFTQPLAISPGADGSVWAGSEGAGLYKFDGQSWRTYRELEGLASAFVWSVLEDSSGAVWAGTWSSGLFRGIQGRFTLPSEVAELRSPITALHEFPQGTLWIGTGNGLARLREGRLERLDKLGGAAAGEIRALTHGPRGELWLGTLGSGLGRVWEDVLTNFTEAEGLAQNYILALCAEAEGTLWIGTSERGLCRLKQGQFSTLGPKQGLPSKGLGHIEEDERGQLWFNSSQGIFAASKSDLHRAADHPASGPVQFLIYSKPEGLPGLAGSAGFTPSGFRGSDGRIWLPTVKGLAIVNPARLEKNTVAPPIAIEEFTVGGRVTATDQPSASGPPLVQIPAGSQNLEIRFTALSFSAPERVRFRWRLEGMDQQWSDPSPNRAIRYSYLHPGSYTFHLVACNNDGLWNSEPASLRLVVLPFFYETWWFKVLLTTVGLMVFGTSIVIFQRGRHRQRLERARREREIETERARIAQDIHDDLGASLTRIGMLSQTAAESPQDQERTSRYLSQIYATAREMTRGMDEIVWAVNPRHDTLESLFNYLMRFAHEFLTPFRIRCRFEVPDEVAERVVRSEVRHNLFLAFKEALHNAARHSGADEVKVGLRLKNGLLTVSISDNGHGPGGNGSMPRNGAPGRIAAGQGLANIQARLQRIGGESRFESKPGQGMRVELVAPLTTDTGVR